MALVVDSAIYENAEGGPNQTGIFVRAMYRGRAGSYDITVLTRESLLEWLRGVPDNGNYTRAEAVCLMLLGHQVDP